MTEKETLSIRGGRRVQIPVRSRDSTMARHAGWRRLTGPMEVTALERSLVTGFRGGRSVSHSQYSGPNEYPSMTIDITTTLPCCVYTRTERWCKYRIGERTRLGLGFEQIQGFDRPDLTGKRRLVAGTQPFMSSLARSDSAEWQLDGR